MVTLNGSPVTDLAGNSTTGPVGIFDVMTLTTTTVTNAVNPSTVGQCVAFSAMVTANSPGAGTPTGTITFSDGTTVLGTGLLSAGAMASFCTTALAAGTHTIMAYYSGDNNFPSSSNAAAPFSQTVNQASTMTIVTDATDPSVFGQSITYTATLSILSPGVGVRPASSSSWMAEFPLARGL